jgi:hypothetical protein
LGLSRSFDELGRKAMPWPIPMAPPIHDRHFPGQVEKLSDRLLLLRCHSVIPSSLSIMVARNTTCGQYFRLQLETLRRITIGLQRVTGSSQSACGGKNAIKVMGSLVPTCGWQDDEIEPGSHSPLLNLAAAEPKTATRPFAEDSRVPSKQVDPASVLPTSGGEPLPGEAMPP